MCLAPPATLLRKTRVHTDAHSCLQVTFYPQGYYTTSLWNGQLNLAKSTELTRLVVAHRGGTELRTAEISVIVCVSHQGAGWGGGGGGGSEGWQGGGGAGWGQGESGAQWQN